MPSLTTILANVKGTTFATVETQTVVALAAKTGMKDRIVKRGKTSITLANNLKAGTDLYLNQVMRSSNDDTTGFVKSVASFTHTDCWSVTQNKANPEQFYLYGLANKSLGSVYIDLETEQELSKQEVAAYMAPKAAEKLLNPPATQYNKLNDVEHTSTPRSFKLASILTLKVGGTTYPGPFSK